MYAKGMPSCGSHKQPSHTFRSSCGHKQPNKSHTVRSSCGCNTRKPRKQNAHTVGALYLTANEATKLKRAFVKPRPTLVSLRTDVQKLNTLVAEFNKKYRGMLKLNVKEAKLVPKTKKETRLVPKTKKVKSASKKRRRKVTKSKKT